MRNQKIGTGGINSFLAFGKFSTAVKEETNYATMGVGPIPLPIIEQAGGGRVLSTMENTTMRLTPTERLLILSLHLAPNQTVSQLARSTDTLHRHRLSESIHHLEDLKLVNQVGDKPNRYALTSAITPSRLASG